MSKDSLYEFQAKIIKRKIFWYFLFRGIPLYKFKILVQGRFGNSDNNNSNEEWWPYGDLIRINFLCKINKKLFWTVAYQNKLTVDIYEELKIDFHKNYISGRERLKKA